MKFSLVVLNAGKAAGQVIPIPLAQFIIGRDPGPGARPPPQRPQPLSMQPPWEDTTNEP